MSRNAGSRDDGEIDNPEPGVTLGGAPWFLLVVIIVIAAGLGVFIFLRKKKG